MIIKILIPFLIIAGWNIENTVSYSENPNKIDWNENNRLIWDDYLGKPPRKSRYNAESSLQISYKLSITKKNNETTIDFTVECLFDKESSWVKPYNKTNNLLEHEQLHFDIAEVYARKLRKDFTENHFTINNYEELSSLIFNNNYRNLQNLQTQYDAETNHGIQLEQQKAWKKKVNILLKNANKFKKKSN